MKKMNLIVLALQSLMLICLSFFTIVKTDEPINYSRNYIEESYEESHSIKQDYFTFEGKKKTPRDVLPSPVPAREFRELSSGYYCFSALNEAVCKDFSLYKGRYPEKDSEVRVTRFYAKYFKPYEDEQWIGEIIEDTNILKKYSLTIVGILDSGIDVDSCFDNNGRLSVAYDNINKLDVSYLCTENCFDENFANTQQYATNPLYYVSKVSSKKELKQILKNKEIGFLYNPERKIKDYGTLPSTLLLTLFFLLLIPYRILTIRYEVRCTIKETLITSIAVFLTGFLATFIVDLSLIKSTGIVVYHFSLGYSAIFCLLFTVVGLLINLSPHIIRYFKNRETNKTYKKLEKTSQSD